jgi:deoxyribodipyrimidine photolyase-related protein
MKQPTIKAQKKKQQYFNSLSNKSKEFENTLKSSTLLLFPNQLFNLNILNPLITKYKINKIIFIEHPLYYGYFYNTKNITQTTNKKYNYNKLKIIYHIAANLYYINEILSKLKINIEYIELFNYSGLGTSKLTNKKLIINYQHPLIYFDTLNIELNNKIQHIFKQYIELDSPILLTSKAELSSYAKKHTGRQNHSAFYKWQKQRLKILTEEKKTYDIQQRIPQSELNNIPEISPLTLTDKKYLTLALNKFKQNNDYSSIFLDNPGPNILNISIDENFLFPISHNGAKKYLDYFMKKKFSSFTKYQDSIVSGFQRNKTQLYHAGISPMMNIGLLLASEIIDIATKKYNSDSKIDKAAYESFIRQIIGWREYQYYIYCFHKERLEGVNYFENTNKLTSVWYSGSTGIKVVDDAIKVAFNYGYLHHIMRLMVVCNFMNLCMIKPDEVFRWFMEFSLDSYEWVMYCNVYSMGIWSDGGVAMRKPYIASDAYIVKMSNYLQVSKDEKDEVKKWMKVWYALYYNFINVKQKQIKRTYYAGMITNWQKKSTQEQKELTQLANDFLIGGYKIKKQEIDTTYQKGGNWITKEDLTNIKNINEQLKEIINKKNTEIKDIEIIKSVYKHKSNLRLIDFIFTGKELKIWDHGINDINSITGSMSGKHYYCVINNRLLELVGLFIRE